MKSNKRRIKVCLSPALFSLYEDRESIVVVVDILRATSAMCVAFSNGVKTIIPVSTIEDALEYKGHKDYILAAERNGEAVPGFDFGNSPLQYEDESLNLDGKTLVMTTTNGTKAINIAKRDHKLIIGSFLNISKLIDWICKQNQNVIVLCAGWKNDFCLEDSLFAGALTDRLLNTNLYTCNNDAANASRELYIKSNNNMFEFLGLSEHRNRLSHLNILSDVKYCLQEDITNVLPILVGSKLVLV